MPEDSKIMSERTHRRAVASVRLRPRPRVELVSPRCSICDHRQRGEIDRALVEGGSVRDVARRFGVGRNAVHRHRKGGHIAEALAKASEVADVARGDDLLTRVRDLEGRAFRILDRAERAGELRVALRAIAEVRSTIKLLADAERRRLMDDEHSISIERLMLLVAGIVDIINRHEPSLEVRAKIAAEIRLLTEPSGE
jgi:transposase-like protein